MTMSPGSRPWAAEVVTVASVPARLAALILERLIAELVALCRLNGTPTGAVAVAGSPLGIVMLVQTLPLVGALRNLLLPQKSPAPDVRVPVTIDMALVYGVNTPPASIL